MYHKHFKSGRQAICRLRERSLATNSQGHRISKQGHEHDEGDFRPPWVYTGSRLLSYIVIPTVAFYSIFFYDFGDKDHVFQSVRRWAARQQAAFFTLSPAENKILEASSSTGHIQPPTQSTDK